MVASPVSRGKVASGKLLPNRSQRFRYSLELLPAPLRVTTGANSPSVLPKLSLFEGECS